MYTINHIQIKGFRRLQDIDLKMRPLMVFIGRNGVGKTSLLDALGLVASSASLDLGRSLSENGGLSNILTRRPDCQNLQLSFDIQSKDPSLTKAHHSFAYVLQLSLKGSGYEVANEQLSAFIDDAKSGATTLLQSSYGNVLFNDAANKGLTAPDWLIKASETALAQVPQMLKQAAELKGFMASTVKYHMLDVSTNAPVRLPQQMRPADSPGINGANLTPYLYTLRETYPDRFEAIIETMSLAFPDFEGLTFPPTGAGMLTMGWKERHFERPMYVHELSEGILRFLWLVSLLHSPSLPSITMIDEPEVSLHPELLSMLAALFRDASERTQLMVATHSDRLVGFLNPDEVVACDLDENGCTSFTWADDLDLEHWLRDYSLGDLWKMGQLGARG